MLKSLGRIEQQHDDFSEVDRPLSVGDREPFQLLRHLGAFAHARCIDQADFALFVCLGIEPFPIHGDRIAGDPCFGAGQQAIFAQQPVDKRGLACVGAPHDGQLQRAVEVFLVQFGLEFRSRFGRFRLRADDGPQPGEQIGNAFAMFGGDAHGFTQAEAIAFKDTRFGSLAFRLVADQHHRHILSAQPAADLFVERGQARACIDDEQGGIGSFEADFGLLAHPAGQAFGIVVFPACGIHDGEFQPGDFGIAHAAIPRDARLVIHQRELLAHEPVEQRGFADIGSADDDYGGFCCICHDRALRGGGR